MTSRYEFVVAGTRCSVEILSLKKELILSVNGKPYLVSGLEKKEAANSIIINGKSYTSTGVNLQNSIQLKINGKTYTVEKSENQTLKQKEKLSSNNITASMPGILIEAFLREDDNVKEGDVILSTESMKMQTNISAPRDGVIEKIHFQKNETFEKGAILVSMKEV